MQELMLGMHGGTVTLMQAEDDSWWHGALAVRTGYAAMANRHTYVLQMDADGMWRAQFRAEELPVGARRWWP